MAIRWKPPSQGDAPTEDADQSPEAAANRAARERSTIAFPYSDLENAIQLARTIKTRAGTSCEIEQLASWMDQSAEGGTFRTYLSAARMFGLIEVGQGKVTLTDLGHDALEDETAATARAEAFLRVPLYAAMYDSLRGRTLPPAAALERQMAGLGVSSKQTDRARQTFTKSATHAGYIDVTSGRFIRPGQIGPSRSEDAGERAPKDIGGGPPSPPPPPPMHPFIEGLLKTLPEPGTVWDGAARAKWLQTAASIFGLIYEGSGEVEVRAKPGHHATDA